MFNLWSSLMCFVNCWLIFGRLSFSTHLFGNHFGVFRLSLITTQLSSLSVGRMRSDALPAWNYGDKIAYWPGYRKVCNRNHNAHDVVRNVMCILIDIRRYDKSAKEMSLYFYLILLIFCIMLMENTISIINVNSKLNNLTNRIIHAQFASYLTRTSYHTRSYVDMNCKY